MSSQRERDWGADVSRQIIAANGRLDDPLLQRWVNRIGERLARNAQRSDVTYTFNVVDSEEVNAFSLPGGYVFVDAGLLNFVHSDDELAAVLGHEIGHVEKRHIVKLNNDIKIAQIAVELARVLLPATSRFGDLAAELALYKISRIDEMQADQLGLRLMTKAGYDPDGMTAFLGRLGELHPQHKSLFGKYFETHPALPDRVKHLAGYPELDRPAEPTLVAQAIADENEGEYVMARAKLKRALDAQPNDEVAKSHAATIDALRSADPPARPLEAKESAALRTRMARDLDTARRVAAAVKYRVGLGEKEGEQYELYLERLGYFVDPQSRRGIPRGNRLDRVLDGQTRMGRSMDHSYDAAATALTTVQDQADGDVKLLQTLQKRLDSPDTSAPLDVARMQRLLDRAEAAHHLALEGADGARAAFAAGWQAGKAVDAFMTAFDHVGDYKGGDMRPQDYRGLRPPLRVALLAAKDASATADAALSLVDQSQALQLMDRIDMLGLDATPQRQAALARVLAQRLGVDAGDFTQAAGGLTPAEVVVAAVAAAENGTALRAEAQSLRSSGDPVAFANAAHVRSETLELELGLVWLSFSDGQT